MPPVNTGLLDGELAWRQHDGGHTDLPNIPHFVNWMEKLWAEQEGKAVDAANAPDGAAGAEDSARAEQSQPPGNDPFPVSIRVEASQLKGPLRRIWRFFGADEPNYVYMKDGRKLLSQLGEMAPDEVYFRTHNLLTSGPGYPALKWGSTNVYTEDADGKPVYDWRISI